MDTLNTELFDRIREKCLQDGWYGGDLLSSRCLHMKPYNPQRAGFAYPPASEEQLAATEAVLGFPLPPLLRTLYAEIANGGFGPGVGIRGALGGYGSPTVNPGDTIVGYYNFHRQQAQLIDLGAYAELWKQVEPERERDSYLLLSYVVWPEQLLSLEDLGCCQEVCLDCKNGGVFCTAPTARNDEYIVWHVTPSLEHYLDRWLRYEALP
jgi:SMI1 / KNR4 family (SUKH-1)